MSKARGRKRGLHRGFLRDWELAFGAAVYVLVIVGASVGLLFGPDAAFWWFPPLVGFGFMPMLIAAAFALARTHEWFFGECYCTDCRAAENDPPEVGSAR